jgi:hypothetical protein
MTAPSQIRSIVDQDGAVLLDMEHDTMIGLNYVGSYVWTKLHSGLSVDQIIGALAIETGEEVGLIEEDVKAFVKELESQHLLGSTTETAIAHRQPFLKARRLIKALLMILSFDALLLKTRALGGPAFEPLRKRVHLWPITPLSDSSVSVDAACEIVESACSWYPKNVLCLQRSAATTCFLRDQGVFAELVVGARKMPFAAHAWVEVSGRVVNDKPGVVARYRVMERL